MQEVKVGYTILCIYLGLAEQGKFSKVMRVKRIFPLYPVQGFTPVNNGISIKTLVLVVSLISGGRLFASEAVCA